jgi:hypothetical protein
VIDVFTAVRDRRTPAMATADAEEDTAHPTQETDSEYLRVELFAITDLYEQALIAEGKGPEECVVCVARMHLRRCGLAVAG